MATNKNDDLNRSGNRSTPQGSTKGGLGSSEQSRNQGSDPMNRDREMNRDRDLGQGSSGTEQGRQGGFGSTGTGTGSIGTGSTGTGSTGTGSTGTGSMGSTRENDFGNRNIESGNRGVQSGNRGNESVNRGIESGRNDSGSDE